MPERELLNGNKYGNKDRAMVIQDLYIGDDYAFDVLVSDVPIGQTLVSGWLTVKRHADDDDDDAVLSINVGTSLTSRGQITTSGQYTNIYIVVPRTQTRLLHSRAEYAYSVKAVTDADIAKTIEQGTIIAQIGVKAGP